MKLLLFLLLLIPQLLFAQPDRKQRLKDYYETKALFDATVADLKRKGIEIAPDYSQPDGGAAFNTFITLKAHLETEAALLGLNEKSFEDGWYKAEVEYSNKNTGTRSTYILDVLVYQNQVIKIYFDKDRYVHIGGTNYTYSGGDLSFGSTIVLISKGNSQYRYDVSIK